MPSLSSKNVTAIILIGSLLFSLVACLAFEWLPILVMNPLFALAGQVPPGFRGLLIWVEMYGVTVGFFWAYCLPGLIGVVSVWYASRLDFDDPSDDLVTPYVLVALAYFFAALLVGFVAESRSGPSSFATLIVLVFIGYPVLFTIPIVSFGLFLAGVIVSPRAISYLTARYDLKRRFAGAIGASATGKSDLQKRLLARQAPPDQMIEDAERFHVENAISDLMIEVEQLRTEIDILTLHRSGGRT